MSWLPDNDDDDGDWAEYDESDARVRPNPKGNRPRSKQRPDHADAVTGRVLGVDRGRYRLWLEGADGHALTATSARELGRGSIVTGDLVDLVGDVSGEEGTLARIVRVQPRSTLLRRSADDTDAVERVIVANADQMLVVVATANPEPRPRLVDRYLVAAYDAGIHPILCMTKTDLADPEPFLQLFDGLDVEIVRSRSDEVPVDELTRMLDGHTTVAVGHSGVGKSTLVNALVPEANRAVGDVNVVTGRGRHTSSSTVSYRVGESGWVVDTPGVRSFGLGHVDHSSILRGFADLAAIAQDCPRGCTHLPDSPDCELVEASRRGELDPARLDSLQRLLTTLGS
jgi:ribosome biogenesis GTPase